MVYLFTVINTKGIVGTEKKKGTTWVYQYMTVCCTTQKYVYYGSSSHDPVIICTNGVKNCYKNHFSTLTVI